MSTDDNNRDPLNITFCSITIGSKKYSHPFLIASSLTIIKCLKQYIAEMLIWCQIEIYRVVAVEDDISHNSL